MKLFKITEYSTGDAGDLGQLLCFTIADNKQDACDKVSKELNRPVNINDSYIDVQQINNFIF